MRCLSVLLAGLLCLGLHGGQALAALPASPSMSYATSGLDVTISWSAVSGANAYTLYYAPYPYTGQETIQTIEQGAALSATYALWPRAAFVFAIRAHNGEGVGDYSNIEYFVMGETAVATDNMTAPPPALQSDSVKVLAKAVPDECYVKAEEIKTETSPGVWQVTGYSHPGGVPPQSPVMDTGGNYVCADGGLPKSNEAYVWGLARSGERLWIGTGANVHCMVGGAYFDSLDPTENHNGLDVVTDVCEYNASWLVSADSGVPAELGDWRPPGIHYHDLATGVTAYDVHKGALNLDQVAAGRLARTVGLRSAGAIGDVVFLAGPSFDRDVNVFAFRSSTAEFLGSYVLDGYSNIRKWRVIGGELYNVVGVSVETVTDRMYGRVLKWVGTPENPLEGPGGSAPFVVVGMLPGAGAELSEYGENRMAVATWPGGLEEGAEPNPNLSLASLRNAGIYLSAPLPAGGLDPAAAAGNFTEIFTFNQYDPDLARAMSYGGGALAWFDGALIWGSMHVPYTAAIAMIAAYGPYGMVSDEKTCRRILDPQRVCTQSNPLSPGDPGYDPDFSRDKCLAARYALASDEVKAGFTKCAKAYADFYQAADISTSVFRGRNLEAADPGEREIDVLYGYDSIKAYRFDTFFGIPQQGKGFWKDLPNGIGAPVFGGPGFDRKSNNYIWEMRVVNGRLFVGTMDYQSLVDLKDDDAGADLFSFVSSQRKAVKEDGGGLGNRFNYGLRTMLPDPSGKLFIGTANPFNLAPAGAGGWELLEVLPQ